MRKYKLIFAGYGGEVTVGRVNPAFVEYWKDKESYDMQEHVVNLGWDEEDIDPNSPPIGIDGDNCSWYECDDFEHAFGVYSDNGYSVVELDENGEEIGEAAHHGFNSTACREAYMCPQDEDTVACMTYHVSEKGYFGDIILEIEDEFDPELFEVSVLETELCEIVEAARYNKEEVEIDYGYSDTRGKGDYSEVGWFNKKFHDREIIWYDEDE